MDARLTLRESTREARLCPKGTIGARRVCALVDLKPWLSKRAEADRVLYDKYGEPLEASHRDQFVAISDDGQTILGTEDVEVLEQAIQRFGSGNFALRRIGHRTMGRWLSLPR